MIKFSVTALASLWLITGLFPASAQVETAAQKPADDVAIRRELAAEIVAIISGAADSTSALQQISASYADKVMQRALAEKGLNSSEKQYPGITNAISKSITPLIYEEIIAQYPQLREIQINIWAERLSATELRKTIRFYKTPMMKKLLNILQNPLDDDFSENKKQATQLAALKSITKADIADFETNKDFDEALADSLKNTNDAWDIQRKEWVKTLTDKLIDKIKVKTDQVIATFIKQKATQ